MMMPVKFWNDCIKQSLKDGHAIVFENDGGLYIKGKTDTINKTLTIYNAQGEILDIMKEIIVRHENKQSNT